MIMMFPEFWASDMTFGLNKERRQLVTICGIDGNSNSFTGLRVWMPSKQRIAYQWALDNALPILIGETTTIRNQMTASDDKLALVDAIKLAINSPEGSLCNSKFCKDYYHLVTKQWTAIVKTTMIKDIDNCSDISDFIGRWIKSWFSYVNDENEFKVSYRNLQNFMINYLPVRANAFHELVKNLIHAVVDSITDVGRHFFVIEPRWDLLVAQLLKVPILELKLVILLQNQQYL
jgi:hypothetical protein